MITFIDVKFIFDIARLGLFSSANVLQIADAIISPSCYSWNEWNVRNFCFHNQNNSTSSPGLLGLRSINLQGSCIFDVIGWLIAKFFQIWSSVAGYGELCVCF